MDLVTETWANESFRPDEPSPADLYTSVLSYEGDIWAGIYLIVICVTAFIGNISVIVISLRKRDKLKPLDLLTINLAIADTLSAILSYPLPMVSAFRHGWSFGRTGCIWYGFTGFFFAVASQSTLTAIALFRYAKLCRENVDQYQSRVFVSKVIVIIWLFSIIVTTPPLFGWSRYVPEPYHLSCTIDFADTSPNGLTYTYFTMITVFLMPLAIIITCYVAIARKMIRHNRRINVGHNAGRMLLEIRLLKTAGAITIAYTISWTPYALIAMWVTFQPVPLIPDAFRILPAFCAKAASVYNPIIYCIFNKSFRRDLCTLICFCACQCYTITINLDTNNHAQHQYHQIEAKRLQIGKYKQRPMVIFASPTWQKAIRETLRKNRVRRFYLNRMNNARVENINVNFRRDRDIVELNVSTKQVPRAEVNTSGRSTGRRNSMVTNLPALEEMPSGAAPQSTAVQVHMPGSVGGTVLQHRAKPSTSDPHDEFLNPSSVLRNMRVIMVKPDIGEESSSDC